MCHSIKMSVMEGVNVLKVIFELAIFRSLENTIKPIRVAMPRDNRGNIVPDSHG